MKGKKVITPRISDARELSGREVTILRSIIHLYLLNASPVGSRNLAKYLKKELQLSPATIRNVMADLEDLELISHPHTSAGRIPTDKGYRFYVDSLMDSEILTASELIEVNKRLSDVDTSSVLKEASKVLGLVSHYLGIVAIPHINESIVQKLEFITLSSNRLLAVLALESNYVKTVTLEADFEFKPGNIDKISRFINEKISGKKISYIKEHFSSMLSEYDSSETPLVRLFVDSVDKLFRNKIETERIHIAGTPNLLSYPEFEDLERVKGVIELIENEDIIIHLLDKFDDRQEHINVLIGNEMQNEILRDYALIVTHYELGQSSGSIGLIGPKRMNYSKMFSLVSYVSNVISKKKN